MYYNFNQYINLGATLEKNGCNFAIYLKEIKTLSLNIFYSSEDTVPYERYILNPSEHRLGNIWSIFLENIKEGTLYNWEINGVPILDPYALAYTGNETIENRKSIVLARVGTETKHILIPKKDMVIYESHIGLFTKSPSSNTLNPATFSAFEEKIPYLKNLGINVVEFLPVFEWDDYTGNLDRESFFLKNVWGYNPINFFALTKKYSSSNNEDSANEINEFKKLVSSLHKNGIEVVLDVVYNHTAEGGAGGKIYNFKAMGEDIFYTKDKENNFINFSGCGNTLNCNHKVVKDMIIQSLLYWYLEVGVDGFRFDLAPVLGRDSNSQWARHSLLYELVEHPILSHAKLIAESWDLGGYFVGAMPSGWCEWNGAYRDTVRQFIRGDFGQVPELIKRIFGSVDIFHANKNGYQSSINFICCHDGFTMWDLVSYNLKHNLLNGENNQDGENNNHSYNHGEEGFTENPHIISLRKQQIKNMILILYISQGIPMLLMGDEMGRTQLGNNNAYCQDNPTTWVDWDRKKDFEDVFLFTKNMINLRKSYSIFKKETPLIEGEEIILHGIKLYQPDLSFHSLSIAFQLKDIKSNTDFYIAFNSYSEQLCFELPILENKSWYIITDTSKTDTCDFKEIKWQGTHCCVLPKSSVILISK